MKELIPGEMIERKIFLIRGEKVMLDADLAALYGVTTKRLNERVKRNRERFPNDFMFQLTEEEKAEMVANCDHLTHKCVDKKAYEKVNELLDILRIASREGKA
jgi:hypothetical protein